MSILEALIFGFVQGLTEFLPISSTAHIVITQLILGYKFTGLEFEIFLHFASVLAVIIYFRKDVWEVIVGFFSYLKTRSSRHYTQFRFAIYILVATVITGGLGVVFSDLIEDSMKTSGFIAASLAVTGAMLIFIERFHHYGNRGIKDMRLLDSIIVGLAQTLAVMPGISRSGTTLVAALWAGLNRDTAVRYSFLLAIPVILGSTVLAVGNYNAEMWATVGAVPLLVAFVATFIFSWIGIIWLIDFLKRSKLIYFAIYCFVLAFLVYMFIDTNIVLDL
ncbi:undecaprenyl-diphosphate phosphatase [Desulfofalx alkaliphila]|uniref:undecaprenyl-diphosphate phosphatase n=1 Tax=Desulfofalx alkaliphila TaxID=105483 RepID=UPI0004E19A7D|nr:undecaprenyl-diphosphate phosphatase [Desulfofalx alkaliphila]